jgi:hypothetical protein
MRSFLPHLLESSLLNRFNNLLNFFAHYIFLINHLTELWLLDAGHPVLAPFCCFSPSCPVRVLVRHPDQQISISFKKLHIIAPFHTNLVILPRYHNQSRHLSVLPPAMSLSYGLMLISLLLMAAPVSRETLAALSLSRKIRLALAFLLLSFMQIL